MGWDEKKRLKDIRDFRRSHSGSWSLRVKYMQLCRPAPLPPIPLHVIVFNTPIQFRTLLFGKEEET